MKKLVIFDLDGTLLTLFPTSARRVTMLLKRWGLQLILKCLIILWLATV